MTYTLDSSLLTESIYGDRFIAAAPYGLTTRVTFEGGNTVNVPANGRVTVNAEINLTDADKEYMNRFPNGIFVEGFVYAVPVSGSEAEQPVSLVMIGPRRTFSTAKKNRNTVSIPSGYSPTTHSSAQTRTSEPAEQEMHIMHFPTAIPSLKLITVC